uniref:Daxx histone-binding domain-containing protein n=1 Tax=Eptatretus burgeri TaxID=7764 RepID=A0A8C4WYV7_EPTBU
MEMTVVDHPRKVFVFIQEVCTTLKANTVKKNLPCSTMKDNQNAKLESANQTATSEITVESRKRLCFEDHDEATGGGVCGPQTSGNGEPLTGQPESKRAKKTGSKQQIRNMEHLLQLYAKEIRKLQAKELDLDEMKNEDSTYIQEHKLKKKMMHIFDRLCTLKGCDNLTGRVIEKPLKFNSTRYPEINKRIQKLANNNVCFPDYQDVLSVVKRANEKSNLSLSIQAIRRLAEECFREVGGQLQERRHLDHMFNFGCHLTDLYKPGSDPALASKELARHLRSNRVEAVQRLEDVIRKYARMQVNVLFCATCDTAPFSVQLVIEICQPSSLANVWRALPFKTNWTAIVVHVSLKEGVVGTIMVRSVASLLRHRRTGWNTPVRTRVSIATREMIRLHRDKQANQLKLCRLRLSLSYGTKNRNLLGSWTLKERRTKQLARNEELDNTSTEQEKRCQHTGAKNDEEEDKALETETEETLNCKADSENTNGGEVPVCDKKVLERDSLAKSETKQEVQFIEEKENEDFEQERIEITEEKENDDIEITEEKENDIEITEEKENDDIEQERIEITEEKENDDIEITEEKENAPMTLSRNELRSQKKRKMMTLRSQKKRKMIQLTWKELKPEKKKRRKYRNLR